MSRTLSLVQKVEIASPCPASWAEMTGDDQVRFCAHCKLNVYNLSEMTEEEGERLIIEKEGKLCARIYRRADGTIITRNCPVGLAELNRRVRRVVFRAAAAVVVIAGAAMSAIRAGGTPTRLGGSVAMPMPPPPPPVQHPTETGQAMSVSLSDAAER